MMNPTITIARRDTGAIGSDYWAHLKRALNPADALDATGTVGAYVGVGTLAGVIVGKLMFKKHMLVSVAIGLIGGGFYGSRVAKAASNPPPKAA